MVRERLDQMWVDRMYSIFENQGDVPDREVAALLAKEGARIGRQDYPAIRTVNKYHQLYEGIDPEFRQRYRSFNWPESMKQGALPWEASPVVLDLRSFLDIIGVRSRPPLGFVQWFYRVSQACPLAEIVLLIQAATSLTRSDNLGEPYDQGIEWWLSYLQIKNSEDRARLYKAAKERPPEGHPIPALPNQMKAGSQDALDLGFWFELIVSLQTARQQKTASPHTGSGSELLNSAGYSPS